MSFYIRIAHIVFDNTPSENQQITIKHRLTSDPDVDGSYTTDTTTQVVGVDGYLLPPYVITGLLSGTGYTVKIINNCDNSEFTMDYETNDCPEINTIAGTTGGGNPF